MAVERIPTLQTIVPTMTRAMGPDHLLRAEQAGSIIALRARDRLAVVRMPRGVVGGEDTRVVWVEGPMRVIQGIGIGT